MRNVFFSVAGKRNSTDKVFFQAQNKGTLKECQRVWHRNDFHTVVSIPQNVFKENFLFDSFSGIYRTELTWGELEKIAKVEVTKVS